MIREPDSLGKTEVVWGVESSWQCDAGAAETNAGSLMMMVMRSRADDRTAVEGEQQSG
jgi:hypothetical protein